MNLTLDNVLAYEDWENDTARLCEVGEKANHYIEKKYFSGEYNAFFTDQSDLVTDFKLIVSYRRLYWDNNPLRYTRVIKWLNEIEHFINTSLHSNNNLGLLKEYVWAKYSTLPLIFSILNHNEDIKNTINHVLDSINQAEETLKNQLNSSSDLHIIQRTRLSSDFVKKSHKQRFINVYQISLPTSKEKIFCEIIETWNFNQVNASIDLCLPLSIGCVALCKMCEFSLFKAINIPVETLKQIIDYQARNNYNAPIRANSKYNFYYLGGGDALQYKNLPSLLSYVAKAFNNPKQIVSTIAYGKIEAFNLFLEQISLIPNVDLQWSLNTFNEANRSDIVGIQSLIPIKACIDSLKQYYAKSGRKITISLMMLKIYNDNIDKLKKDILTYLNPEIFKLNFANVQPNSLALSKNNNTYDLNNIFFGPFA